MPPSNNPSVLSLKEELFVAAYLEHQSASEAARIAFKPKSASVAGVLGFRQLRKDKIRVAIRAGFEDRIKVARVTKAWLIGRAATIAKGSMRQFLMRQDGKLVPKHSDDIPDEALDAIHSIKVLRETTRRHNEGTPEEASVTEEVIEIKLHNPGPELDKLFKYHGLYFEASDLKMIREELDAIKAEQAQRRRAEQQQPHRNGNGKHVPTQE